MRSRAPAPPPGGPPAGERPRRLPRRARRTRSSSSHSTCPPSGWWRWRCWSCARSSCPRPRSRPHRPAAGHRRRSRSDALHSRGRCKTAQGPSASSLPLKGREHGERWPRLFFPTSLPSPTRRGGLHDPGAVQVGQAQAGGHTQRGFSGAHTRPLHCPSRHHFILGDVRAGEWRQVQR